MAFNKGTDHIEAAHAAAALLRKSSDRIPQWFLKAGEAADVAKHSSMLRFITPTSEWIEVAMHSAIKTKPGPATATNWPSSMFAVCRYDVQIAAPNCYICDNNLADTRGKISTPSPRTYAFAVERDPIIVNGRTTGLVDRMQEYAILDADGKPTAEKAMRPSIVLVTQGWKNFFGLISAMDKMRGDIRKGDFSITREGTGTDTTYVPTPYDSTPDHQPGTESWKAYDAALLSWNTTLDEVVLSQSSDEHYARWFDPTVEVDVKGNIVAVGTAGSNGGGSAANVGLNTDDEAARLKALRDQLTKS